MIGAFQNSYVEVRKHTSSTLRMFSLSALRVLQRDEPNEIQIKISKSELPIFSFFKFNISFNYKYILGGVIHVIVNKYDKFIAPDPTPLTIKYVSFAGYDNSPVEFFYNCTVNKTVSAPNAEKLATDTTTPHEIYPNVTDRPRVTSVKRNFNLIEFSSIEFALLIISTMILTINIVIAYYVFSLAKYIE